LGFINPPYLLPESETNDICNLAVGQAISDRNDGNANARWIVSVTVSNSAEIT
jgi:hypothetical protein